MPTSRLTRFRLALLLFGVVGLTGAPALPAQFRTRPPKPVGQVAPHNVTVVGDLRGVTVAWQLARTTDLVALRVVRTDGSSAPVVIAELPVTATTAFDAGWRRAAQYAVVSVTGDGTLLASPTVAYTPGQATFRPPQQVAVLPQPPATAMPVPLPPPPTVTAIFNPRTPDAPYGIAPRDTITIRGTGLSTVTQVALGEGTYGVSGVVSLGTDFPMPIVARSDTELRVEIRMGGSMLPRPHLIRVTNPGGSVRPALPLYLAPFRVVRSIDSLGGTFRPRIVSPFAVVVFAGAHLDSIPGHLNRPTVLFIGSTPPGTADNPPIPITTSWQGVVLATPDDCDREGWVQVGSPPVSGNGPLALSVPRLRVACAPRDAARGAIDSGTAILQPGGTFIIRGRGLRVVEQISAVGSSTPSQPLAFRFVPGPNNVGGHLEVTVQGESGRALDFTVNLRGGFWSTTANGRVVVSAAP